VSPLASVLATLLWGGIVAVDTAAFLQLLLSQPFVAGAVTGALWGRMEVGLELGAILQLFSLGVLPVGGRAPEDFPVGTVVGTAAACALTRLDPVASAQGGPLLFGLLAAFVTALCGRPLLVLLRHRNEGLARWVEDELAQGHLRALGRAQVAGIAQTFAFGALWTAVALTVSALVGRALFAHSGIAFGRAWQAGSPLLWGFGAGLVVKGLTRGRRQQILFWCALVTFLALRLWLSA
jgi:mannose/fructose/N-acetylgalactosamine-specific phosphotransferase system component IIC